LGIRLGRGAQPPTSNKRAAAAGRRFFRRVIVGLLGRGYGILGAVTAVARPGGLAGWIEWGAVKWASAAADPLAYGPTSTSARQTCSHAPHTLSDAPPPSLDRGRPLQCAACPTPALTAAPTPATPADSAWPPAAPPCRDGRPLLAAHARLRPPVRPPDRRNRYELDERQRKAVARCACTDAERDRRVGRRATFADLAGAALLVDGYNVLTTVEAALGGAPVLAARDTTVRDVAGVHGTYRHVEETLPALALVGACLAGTNFARCEWLLDAPVSNSGRLKATIEAAASAAGWAWSVRVVPDPDVELKAAASSAAVIATADGAVLDAGGRWFGLAGEVVRTRVADALWVDLAD
jgi:hypothetical protein